MSVMFECKGLTKKYGTKVALNHVDLSLESGRIVGLLGPNGSGKTTMLKLANGLLTPTDGGIFIVGTDCRESTDKIYFLRGAVCR